MARFQSIGAVFLVSLLLQSLAEEGNLESLISNRRTDNGFSVSPGDTKAAVGSYWRLGGNAEVTPEGVLLTRNEADQRGSMWASKSLEDTETEIRFRLTAQGDTNIGGDGFGMWISDKPHQWGEVMGYTNSFDGLGIIVDTYNNDREESDTVIYPVDSKGFFFFDKENDGRASRLEGAVCPVSFRNSGFGLEVMVLIAQGRLIVSTRTSDAEEFRVCFAVHHGRPLRGKFLGFTADTGGVADNNQVTNVQVSSLLFSRNARSLFDQLDQQSAELRAEQEIGVGGTAPQGVLARAGTDVPSTLLAILVAAKNWVDTHESSQKILMDSDLSAHEQSVWDTIMRMMHASRREEFENLRYNPSQRKTEFDDELPPEWESNAARRGFGDSFGSDSASFEMSMESLSSQVASLKAELSKVHFLLRTTKEETENLIAARMDKLESIVANAVLAMKGKSIAPGGLRSTKETDEMLNTLRGFQNDMFERLSRQEDQMRALATETRRASTAAPGTRMHATDLRSVQQSLSQLSQDLKETSQNAANGGYGKWAIILIAQISLFLAYAYWKKHREESKKLL